MSTGTAGDGATIKALFWMMGALASFALMAIAGRELSAEVGAFQIVFFRSAIATAVLQPRARATLVLVLSFPCLSNPWAVNTHD